MNRPAAAAGLGLALALAGAAPAPVAARVPAPARIAVVPVDIGTRETLLDVAFPDAGHGFAVGENGAILASTDGGQTWARQRSGVEVSAEEVASRVAGQRAARQPVNLFGVWFIDAHQGWAVGTDTILTTSDGGQVWSALAPPRIDSIAGDGPGRLGQPQRAITWDFRAVRFSDSQRGVVVGGGGAVLVTADGGRTWAWHGDRRFGSLDDVSFADPANGQAVGEAGGGGSLPSVSIATADAGSTWELREATGVGPEVSAIGFAAVATPGPTRTYVAGGAGRIFVTVDGGRRWSVQRRDTTERFQGIAFAGPDRGVAVGLTDFSGAARASLVATDDGGETWASRLVTGEILWDVAFASSDTAYAVGCGERVPAGEAVSVVQADDGLVAQVQPCRQSILLRISFADAGGSDGGGGGGVPWLLIAAGIGVGVVALGLVVVRKPAGGRVQIGRAHV